MIPKVPLLNSVGISAKYVRSKIGKYGLSVATVVHFSALDYGIKVLHILCRKVARMCSILLRYTY